MKIGVIIGRFQTPYLHEAHMQLIKKVCAKHKKVIVLLGLSPLKTTSKNPLDYEARRRMINAEFPEIIVGYIKDTRDDSVWSRNLDGIINDLKSANDEPILYGSRDSFIPYYSGCNQTVELDSDAVISATQLRDDAKARVRNSTDFRAGVVWATGNKYPTCFTTVDVAVFNGSKLLLGRKKDESKFRFLGGFSEPNSPSFEYDANREVMEEAKININSLVYRGSFKINDWRYRGAEDQIKTLLYTAQYESGRAEPGDDIYEVRWFEFSELTEDQIIEEHIPLFQNLKN